MSNCEILIIGGGPAGSSAAIQLAQAGRDVLVLEKETGPQDKICGEFISIEARACMERLRLDLKAFGAVPINALHLVHQSHLVSAPLPFEAQSLSRRAMDEALLQKAQQNGAQIRRGVTVTNLEYKENLWHAATGTKETFTAKTVFLASGKHDLRGFQRQIQKGGNKQESIGFKMHFRPEGNQAAEVQKTVELILFQGGYAGLEPVENGLLNLCLLVSKNRFAKNGKNWENLLQSLLDETPLLTLRLRNAAPQWPKPLAISGVPYGFVFQDKGEDENLYRLGDQMAVIPSFCGDGMAIALYTAELAVQHYLTADARSYHGQARKILLPQIRRAQFLSRLVAGPMGQKTVLILCRMIPKLIGVFIRQTRIRNA